MKFTKIHFVSLTVQFLMIKVTELLWIKTNDRIIENINLFSLYRKMLVNLFIYIVTWST